jgi:hypothetical protein
MRIREEIIEELVNLFQATIAQLMESKLCEKANVHDEEACCALMLAYFTKALYPLGLGSQKIPASSVKASIRNIARELSKYPFSRSFPGLITFCNLGKVLVPKVENILTEVPSAVVDHHRYHIEDQAKKSGVAHLEPPNSEKWQDWRSWQGREKGLLKDFEMWSRIRRLSGLPSRAPNTTSQGGGQVK